MAKLASFRGLVRVLLSEMNKERIDCLLTLFAGIYWHLCFASCSPVSSAWQDQLAGQFRQSRNTDLDILANTESCQASNRPQRFLGEKPVGRVHRHESSPGFEYGKDGDHGQG